MATNQWPKPRIRLLRENQGLTRSTVAAHLGVSINALYDWEMKSCKANEILGQILLCEALRCHPEDLIDTSLAKQSKSLEQIRQQIHRTGCSESGNAWPKSKISGLRKAMNLRQEQLADAIGVEQKTLQNWEAGRTSSKKLVHLIRLCEILRCRPRDLIYEIPESSIERFSRVLNRDPALFFNNEQNLNTNNLYDSSINSIEEDRLNWIRKNVRTIHSRLHTLDPKM